jgi:hypothetical protein
MPAFLPDARPRGVLPGVSAKLPRQQEGVSVAQGIRLEFVF